MNPEQSRQAGQALMAFSVIHLLLFLIGISKRSYAALALPILGGLVALSGVAFWVGWTLSATKWDEDES